MPPVVLSFAVGAGSYCRIHFPIPPSDVANRPGDSLTLRCEQTWDADFFCKGLPAFLLEHSADSLTDSGYGQLTVLGDDMLCYLAVVDSHLSMKVPS